MSEPVQLTIYDDYYEREAKRWTAIGKKIIPPPIDSEKDWHQWHYRNDRLLYEIPNVLRDDDKDRYISVMDFYMTRRRVACVTNLYSLFVDLDFYKLGLKPNFVLKTLERDFFGVKTPAPSIMVDSGSGFYLIWFLDPVMTYKELPRWQMVEDELVRIYSPLGADALVHDAARVLRIPGSVHSRTGKRVEIIRNYDARYNIETFESELDIMFEPIKVKTEINPRPPQRPTQQPRRQQQRVGYIYSVFSLNWTRVRDLYKLCEIRKFDLGSETLTEKHKKKQIPHGGLREFILFLVRYWTCYFERDPEIAIQAILELNSKFTYPLDEAEVISATKSAETIYLEDMKKLEEWEEGGRVRKRPRQKYSYSNKRLIELLRISEDEQRQMKTIISTEEKYNRNNKRRTPRSVMGLTLREQRKMDTIQAVKELVGQGFRQVDIAKEIGISTARVSQIVNHEL